MRTEASPSRYATYLRKLGLFEKQDRTVFLSFPGINSMKGALRIFLTVHTVEGWTVTETIRFLEESGDRPFCVQASLPRPHECYTPDRQFWDMYPDDLALPPTLYNSAAHRPPHFQAMAEHLKQYEFPIKPSNFEAGCRRVSHAYLACITQVDYSLGELVSYLERTGKRENTIIIYGSDHGAYSGTYGIAEKAPGICSEAVCRVPMVWSVRE